MRNQHIVGLVGLTLILTSFAGAAESDRQQTRERIMDQVLKPCEGKKAGDKVVMVAIETAFSTRTLLSGERSTAIRICL